MASETEDLLTTLQRLTADLMKTVNAAPKEALDWKPGPDTNSVWAIATHALGACRHWLVAVIAREGNPRDRDSEFLAAASEVADLQRTSERWLADAQRILTAMSSADLDAPADLARTTGMLWPRMGTISNRAAVLHVVEHLGLHIGHVELTLQLWQMQHAPAAG